jgi:23S rRNA G2069 N7-methylase RlmK/C1962 C5-methylase RlmI
MTSYGPRSILQGVERGNTDAVRRIMSALMMRLAGTADDVAIRVSCLTTDEQDIYTRIFNSATSTEDTLLMNMMRRFASALYADDAAILKAADDFDNLAVTVVQDSAMGNTEQLESARRKFRQLVQTGELVYHQVTARKQRKEPKTSGEDEQAEDVGRDRKMW